MTASPRQPSPGHRVRAGLLGALGALTLLGLAGLTAVALRELLTSLGAQAQVQVSDAVTVLALVVLVLALIWSAVLLTACSLELLRAPRTYRPDPVPFSFAPDLALRLTGLLLAITAFSGSTGVAQAMTSPDGPVATAPAAPTAPVPGFGPELRPGHGTTNDVPVPGFSTPERSDDKACPSPGTPVPGWTPERPIATRVRAAEHVRLMAGCSQQPDEMTEIVVHQGDDLWSLVERHLGPGADAARIAQEWPRWYAHNRHVIGDDPNLLLVGQTLQVPTEGALR